MVSDTYTITYSYAEMIAYNLRLAEKHFEGAERFGFPDQNAWLHLFSWAELKWARQESRRTGVPFGATHSMDGA